jgi:hypothetical protein
VKIFRVVLAGLSLLSAGGAYADIWRWVDDAGHVNYGERPPAGRDAVRIRETPGSAAEAVDGAPNGSGELSTEPEPTIQEGGDNSVEVIRQRAEDFERERLDRTQGRAEEAARKEQEAKRQANCERARSNLESLTSRGQASIKEGEDYRVLSEEERQNQVAQMNKFVDEHCGAKPHSTVSAP